MTFPRLTVEEQREFKVMYKRGYSAVIIFKHLGQKYTSSYRAGNRMRGYRIRLGLKRRPSGFRPKMLPSQEARRIEALRLREDSIEAQIHRYEIRKITLRQELAEIRKVLRKKR